ncbi:MAG: MBL fold metallo-hydrolase [Candidatus Woesearchaeota archaeon]
MNICVIGSGSSGNSFLIENDEISILVDAGFSYKELKKRLSKIGKEINEIKAVIISHEHTDHIKGVEKLFREEIPIFMNRATYEFSDLRIKPTLFETNKKFLISDFEILPFRQEHDAIEPCGFTIEDIKTKKVVSIMTDLGKPNENNINAIKNSNAIIIESNHDIDMLINGPYPYNLKQRILSNKGHLSNIDASLFVKNNATENLEKVVLSHLSKINNTHELAFNTFMNLTNEKYKTYISKQYSTTELIKV